MIEVVSQQPEGVLELEVRGKVTGTDYDEVLIPAVEAALEKTLRVRLLCHLGPDFEGYTLGAAWDDARLGLRHWNAFERMAIVSDVSWLRETIRAVGFLVPCPIQLFGNDGIDDAWRWLRESLGAIHLAFDEGQRQLTIRLIGKLEPSAYDGVDEEIDGCLAGLDRVRLLLDLREFDGWQGLGALGDHLSLVREHRKVPERVAIVGNEEWQRFAAGVMSRFVNAEARYFPAAQWQAAEAWLAAAH